MLSPKEAVLCRQQLSMREIFLVGSGILNFHT